MLKSSPCSEGSSLRMLPNLGKMVRGHVLQQHWLQCRELGSRVSLQSPTAVWANTGTRVTLSCTGLQPELWHPAAISNTTLCRSAGHRRWAAEAAAAKGCHKEAQQWPCPFQRLPTERPSAVPCFIQAKQPRAPPAARGARRRARGARYVRAGAAPSATARGTASPPRRSHNEHRAQLSRHALPALL